MKEYSGSVSKILWQSSDPNNQWKMFVLLAADGEEHVCTGIVPGLRRGLSCTLQGEWQTDKKGRRSFVVASLETQIPPGEDGVVGFLEMLRGIGTSTAKLIYAAFGDDAINVLETQPEKYLEIKGISEKKLNKIRADFIEKRGIEKLIRFLKNSGISSTAMALKLYREYGARAIALINENPYILTEIRGIGFKTADDIAEKLGIPLSSTKRLMAGLAFALQEASGEGHVYQEISNLIASTQQLLSRPEYTPSYTELAQIIKDLDTSPGTSKLPLVVEQGRVYLRYLYKAEVSLAEAFADRGGALNHNFDSSWWVQEYQRRESKSLHPNQVQGIITALNHRTAILTGGAGTGKSTVTHAVVLGWRQRGFRVLAMAPSNKAAKRLSECTGLAATTVHAGLEMDNAGEFRRNRENPLACDALVIDEASMIGCSMWAHIMNALPAHAQLLIVGDPNQLPSIEPGRVLLDLIESGLVPSVRLTHIFRQGAGSLISYCANQVNEGRKPTLEPLDFDSAPAADALFLSCSKDEIMDNILKLCADYLPGLGFKPEDIYVNSPQNRNRLGNYEINQALQNLWNPAKPGHDVGGFRLGDRVMQIRNDRNRILPSGRFLVNGDEGIVTDINPADRELTVSFEGAYFTYSGLEIQDIILSYALSVHRCQGSEFPVVIVPMTMAHYMMLRRPLLYTGMTRAKKLLIVVGERRAIETAIRNVDDRKRLTLLTQRMKQQSAELMALRR